jgi:phosphoribosylformylglycinamidine synthase
MASRILDEAEDARSAVQVPDPFLKRVLRNATLAAIEAARQEGVAVGFKDLGAGGIACMASEIAHAGGVGVEVDLDAVHLEEEGIGPEVIACAETQERFGWAVPRRFSPRLLAIYNDDWELGAVSRGARASVIGRFLPEERVMRVLSRGEVVGEAATAAITAGVVAERTAAPRREVLRAQVEYNGDLAELALRVLRCPNVSSKRELFSHYDQEVRAGTQLRPGEADAGVARPMPGAALGVALSSDGNPWYGEIDAYWGGANAVVEAVRNVVATGARPRALTDCLNFGNPEKPAVFRDFEESVRGIADAARGLGTLELDDGTALPFVSGNVSFYNESSTGRAVPPSPIVCCLGVLPDAAKAAGVRLAAVGDRIVLVGERRDELGGSSAAQVLGQLDRGRVPTADFAAERRCAIAVLAAIEAGAVRAAHDVSGGGLVTALAEMMLGAWARVDLGLEIDVRGIGSRGDFERLFSETGAYVVEIADGPLPEPIAAVPHIELGWVTASRELRIRGETGEIVLGAAELEEAWGRSFREVLG